MMIYLSFCPPPPRGHEPVAPARGGRAGVRGRDRSWVTRPGGAGAPPGGTKTPRQELADGACCSPRPKPERRDAPKGVAASGPKAKKPPKAWPGCRESAGRRAERRHACPQGPRAFKDSALSRRAVPLSFGRGRNDLPPRRRGSQSSDADAPRERWSLSR